MCRSALFFQAKLVSQDDLGVIPATDCGRYVMAPPKRAQWGPHTAPLPWNTQKKKQGSHG
jgi:hypothetical protein